MDERFLIAALTVIVSVTLSFLFSLILDKRRNSQRQARELNPTYFRMLHRRTVLLREAVEGFGSVWRRDPDPFNPLSQNLYKILVAKIEDFNREVSVSTNEDVFYLPRQLQTTCEAIKLKVNRAVWQTDIDSHIRITIKRAFEEELASDEEPAPDDDHVEVLKSFPKSEEELQRARYVELRRQPVLSGSPFCKRWFRFKLVKDLKHIEARIKWLAVD